MRGAIGSAFTAAPGPLGAATWPSIATRLDARADGWRDAYAEVCAAARDGTAVEVERADRRRVCLHEQTHALDSALEVLAIADDDVIAHAPQMVEALPNPTACGGELAIAAASSLDAPAREQVRRTAALAESLILANKAALAIERIEERLAEPAIAADPAAAAKLGVLAAGATRALGDMQGAAAKLDAAYLQARTTDSRELVLMAAMEYVTLHAALREPKPARQWIERARVEARALGDERALAVLEGREAQAFAHAGDYAEAIAKANTALAHFDELGLGDTQPAIDVIANRGTFHFSRRELSLARASKLDALRRQATLVDGEHPMMAKHISDLGLIAMRSGDLDGAKEYLVRGLELVESAYTEPHPAIGESLAGLGGLAARRADYESARGYNERALANLIPTVGEDSAAVALIYNNQAAVLFRLGRRVEGIEAHRRAIAIKQRILGLDHPDLALSYANLAAALANEGDDAQVESLFRKALAIQRARDEPAPRLATESRMAHWLADRDRADEARELAERVLAAAEALDGDKVHALYALATISTGETRRAHARAALAIADAGETKLSLALRELAADAP
ncbi:MAG: tetratricopeptide repeat protein [Myxococcales bacterium]|nr:tetratricopeptide repeat protein [Myxococcales bacterium]